MDFPGVDPDSDVASETIDVLTRDTVRMQEEWADMACVVYVDDVTADQPITQP